MKKIPVRHITATIKEPELSGNFNIRDINKLLSGKDMMQDLHRHNFFFVLAIKKGKGEHTIDFIPYSIGNYAVFFMRPGQVHQLFLTKDSTGFLMEFNHDFYSPREASAKYVLRKVSSKNFCSIGSGDFENLISILNNIFKEFSDKQERHIEVIRANLEIFFIELVRQSRSPGINSNKESFYAQDRLEELLLLLESNIATKKQVSDYAAMMYLTPYQLNNITKMALGKACSMVINEHIILEIKRQLLATSMMVNQIADELGYDDPSYFIRFFKKHTGYTPDAFRKNFK